MEKQRAGATLQGLEDQMSDEDVDSKYRSPFHDLTINQRVIAVA